LNSKSCLDFAVSVDINEINVYQPKLMLQN
jgi:hypothetical protein